MSPVETELVDALRTISDVPALLKATRTRLQLTQRDVASHAGVSQALVVRIEGGATNLQVSTLVRLLSWLAVAVTRPTPPRVPGRRPDPRG